MRSALLTASAVIAALALAACSSDNTFGYTQRSSRPGAATGNSGDTTGARKDGGTSSSGGGPSSGTPGSSSGGSGPSANDAGAGPPVPTPPPDAGPPPAQCNAKCLPTSDGYICFAKATNGKVIALGCNDIDGFVCTVNDQPTSEGNSTCDTSAEAKSLFLSECGCY